MAGCGASLPPPQVSLVAAVVEAQPPPPPLPSAATCEKPDGATAERRGAESSATGERCFAREAFREWLCGQAKPGPALALFHKGTPWTRAYVSRDLESWDPSRHRSKKSRLALDEEVIVLHPYKESGGMIVDGGGAKNPFGWTSVEAVRVDGTCISLMADEITMKRPLAPKHAPIAWEKLPEQTRTELLASPELRKKGDQMVTACANAKPTEPRCATAKRQLTDAVVATLAPTQD